MILFSEPSQNDSPQHGYARYPISRALFFDSHFVPELHMAFLQHLACQLKEVDQKEPFRRKYSSYPQVGTEIHHRDIRQKLHVFSIEARRNQLNIRFYIESCNPYP